MENKIAKPFLKWAGGKTQLITEIEKSLPIETTREKFTYIEPFVGSGAILFWMLNNFPKLEKAVINDINEDLINTNVIIDSRENELNLNFQHLKNQIKSILGVPLTGRAFRYNLLFVPHKRISTAIPNAKLAT